MYTNRVKILATVGPSCNNKKSLQKMVDLGVNAFRVNMSHGTKKQKVDKIKLIKSLKDQWGMSPCILADLAGPKIRIEKINCNSNLSEKDILTISNDPNEEKNNDIIVTQGFQFTDISEGGKILINDGRTALIVKDKISPNTLKCSVVVGGLIEERKGVNFPGISLDIPTISQQDKDDLIMSLNEGVDWIALSFVRSAKDYKKIKKIMSEQNIHLPVMAKIEKWEAIKELDSIVETFDALMVARGDLGVEIPETQVPQIQKKIIETSNSKGKPVIIATQFLENMVENPFPTRAEVSDIANAIYDGADGLLVTGETAVGKFPLKVIQVLQNVIKDNENLNLFYGNYLPGKVTKTAEGISHAVSQVCKNLNVSAILTMTHSGGTARMISRHRPSSPIIALTPFKKIARQMSILWGVKPILVGKYKDIDEIPELCRKVLNEKKLIRDGELFVFTGGVPMNVAGSTNYLSIQIK